jgi:hypothetical protein
LRRYKNKKPEEYIEMINLKLPPRHLPSLKEALKRVPAYFPVNRG